MTDVASDFSTMTPCVFIAMSARPAVPPKTSRATQSSASEVGRAVSTRLAQNATIVAATSGRDSYR
jgi:hypothetical protein